MIRMLGSVSNIFFQRILLVALEGLVPSKKMLKPDEVPSVFCYALHHQSERKLVRLEFLWQHTGIWSINY